MKHMHHIIPKYMGGTDEPSNLIELTVEEHAEAHRVLYEKHGNKQDLIAYKTLSGQIGQDEAIQQARSIGGKRKMSEESKAKLRESCRKRTERWKKEGRWEEMNAKRSKAAKGVKKSPEAIENFVMSRKSNGSWHSDKTKNKISQGLKGNTNALKIRD